MKPIRLLRAAGLASALFAALSANAASLHVVSSGGFLDSGVYPRSYGETVVAQAGGFGPLNRYDTLIGSLVPGVGYPTVERYAGTAGDFAFTILTTVYDSGAIAGTWEVDAANCTGVWIGVVGSGTYVRAIVQNSSPHFGDSTLTLDGTVDFAPPGPGRAPVPEPASLAALGLGTIVCARRRKGQALR